MGSSRAAHQASSVGARALLTGGCAEPHCSGITQTSELYDPTEAKFVAGPNMADRRVAHLSIALSDSRVLIAGGWNGREAIRSAELFDARALRFVRVDSMHEARFDSAGAMINSSDVLIVGGATQTNLPTDSAERFDVASMRFTRVASMQTPRAHHTATSIGDGRVLVTGGLVAKNTATASVEIYDSKRNTFVAARPMSGPRCKHAAVRLLDGRIMVIGGSINCGERTRLASTEIFDPTTGRWESGPSLQHPRYKIANSVTVAPDGRVIVAGDAREIEVWVPGAQSFVSLSTSIDSARAFSTATILSNGTVLVAGGYDDAIRPTAEAWVLQRNPR